MADKQTVHNAPAGGDQSQASTNDDNINDVLHNMPYVVTITDGETVGVVARFSDQADAEASAEAFKAKRPQKRIETKALKENDPDAGLPALVAEVAAANLPEETEETAAAPAGTPVAAEGEAEAEAGAYTAMSKADLQAEADARGVEYSASATKADIVAALEADDAAG